MPTTPYTFDEMRNDLVRNRNRPNTTLRAMPFFTYSERTEAAFDRMIAIIDAMTPLERTLSNVVQFSDARQKELASAAGVAIGEVRGLLGGRQSVERVRRVYLTDDDD